MKASLRRVLLALGCVALTIAPACTRAEDVDYRKPSAWLCRPGRHDACDTRLDAIRLLPDGLHAAEQFTAAVSPTVDCFYVYPTVSREIDDFSDLAVTPEVADVARTQAARFAAQCRVFAPVYRQLTLPGLERTLKGGNSPDFDPPYRDVRSAWRDYLAHDNHGRGVVLVGHSQGSILLARLLAEEIDGKPEQHLLVSAILAGHPAIVVPKNRDVGGTFRTVPLCRAAGQFGCVLVWSSYLADDTNSQRVFGRDPGGGSLAACVDPAALLGSDTLDAFFTRDSGARRGEPVFLEVRGLLSAHCVRDAQGAVLRVGVAPGADAARLGPLLGSPSPSGWGLHPFDVALVQGDLVRLVGVQAASWSHAARRAH